MGEEARDSSQLYFEEIEDDFDWDDIITEPLEESGLEDKWQTQEQKKRDRRVTELFTAYVEFYQGKAKAGRGYKLSIFIICIIILLAVIGCLAAVTWFLINNSEKNPGEIAAIISAYITLAVSIVGVFKLVVEYVFPKDDEKYITEIVKAIQQNDLENKKENIRAKRAEDY